MRAALLLIVGPLLASAMTSAAASEAQAPEPAPVFRSVDIGGRSLRLFCAGEGSPTVVIMPSGNSMEKVLSANPPYGWSVVFGAVKKTTHVCIYDRAGLGKSDPAPGPPINSVHVASDLRALLVNAEVSPPYVLAGQSFGGMNSRMYAHLYPETVAGMVLIDSSHPDQYPRYAQVLPKRTPGESPILTGLREGPANVGVDFKANGNLVRATNGLGDKPLIVLTASPDRREDFVPDEWEELIQPIWLQLQADLVKLSTRGKQIVAKNAGHNIQLDDPQLVIDAINDVVAQVRDPR